MPRRNCATAIAALGWLALPALAHAHPLDDLPEGHWYEVPDSHLRDVAASPDEFPWVAQGEGISGIINDWCSGAYDSERDRLYIGPCGGHNGYYGNEVYAFDLVALEWIRVNDPQPIVTSECPDPNAYPCALHTYDGLEYLPPPVDGLLQIGGWEAPMTYLMDPDAGTWTVHPNWEQGRTGDVAAWDPVGGLLWAHSCAYAGTGRLSQWDPSSGEWTVRTDSILLSYYHTATVDPTRRLFVAVGDGEVLTWTLDGDVVMTTLSTTGDTAIADTGNPGLEYDPEIDRIVAWHGGGDVVLLDLDAATWELRTPAADNGVVPGPANGNGTYGRFRYVPSFNAYIVVSSVDENVFLYKLSAAPGPGPGDDESGSEGGSSSSEDDSGSGAGDGSSSNATTDVAPSTSGSGAGESSSAGTSGGATDPAAEADGCSCNAAHERVGALAWLLVCVPWRRRRINAERRA